MDVAELATAVSSSRLQPQAIHPAPSVPDKERPWKIVSIDLIASHNSCVKTALPPGDITAPPWL